MLLASVLMVFMDGQCKPSFNVTALVGNRALLGRKLYF